MPDDLLLKINKQFSDRKENQEVLLLVSGLWKTHLNIGPAQLARAILTLGDGNVDELKRIASDFYGDPRDVIMRAEVKAGSPGHYFIPPFEE